MTNQQASNRVKPDLLELLKKQLNLTEDGINKKINTLRKERGFDIFRADAALLLASLNKIDITKFANDEKLKEIRALKDKEYTILSPKTKIEEKDRIIKLKDITIKSREPYIPKVIISNSKEMSQYYAMLYILENVLRNLIREVYKNEIGYWDKKVPDGIKKEVLKTELKEKYFEERRKDELEYAHLDFLKQIVVHNWNDFTICLKEKDKKKFIFGIEKFMPCRHAIAHTTFFKKLEAQRCQYQVEEILKMF